MHFILTGIILAVLSIFWFGADDILIALGIVVWVLMIGLAPSIKYHFKFGERIPFFVTHAFVNLIIFALSIAVIFISKLVWALLSM